MLGAMIQVVRLAAGPAWTPPTIRIESPNSEWVCSSADLEASRMQFGGSVLAIAVPYALLDSRLNSAAPIGAAPNKMTAEPDAPDDFVESLHQAVASLSTQTPMSIRLGAEIASTSPRSLRRWLAREGTSWRQIVDRVRFEACGRMLCDPAVSLTRIASELRYADQAHFTRAFQRWTGETPSLYRQRRMH
jgi:AraC-like DNA-binding protein